jgi:hypothetical protein
MATDEATHLISGKPTGKDSKIETWLKTVFHVENRILFAGFWITLAFSYTQVPYVKPPSTTLATPTCY